MRCVISWVGLRLLGVQCKANGAREECSEKRLIQNWGNQFLSVQRPEWCQYIAVLTTERKTSSSWHSGGSTTGKNSSRNELLMNDYACKSKHGDTEYREQETFECNERPSPEVFQVKM